MAAESRAALKAYFELNDRPTQAQFANLIDSMHNITDDGAAAVTGGNTYSGPQDYSGNTVEGYRAKVVTGVSGTLTAEEHSGNIIKTSGNITVPTSETGFICTIIAGGAHTVTFNATTSAAMSAGDIMTVIVESATVIHASLLPAASKVVFS